jgi:hypothetical protein
MKRRAFAILSAVSLALCLATAVLWVVSYRMDFWHQGVKVYGDVSIGVCCGQLSVYNRGNPYLGRILDYGEPTPRIAIWNGMGICYRHIVWPNSTGPGWLILRVDMAYPQVVTTVLPGIWLAFWLAARRRRREKWTGCCTKCGYDLRGNPSGKTCPECETPIPADLVRPPLA